MTEAVLDRRHPMVERVRDQHLSRHGSAKWLGMPFSNGESIHLI